MTTAPPDDATIDAAQTWLTEEAVPRLFHQLAKGVHSKYGIKDADTIQTLLAVAAASWIAEIAGLIAATAAAQAEKAEGDHVEH